MKLILVVAFVCSSLYAAGAELTDEQKGKLVGYHKECLESTKVDLELVKKARQGEFNDDEKLKEYAVCIAKKIGFLDDSSKVQKNVVVAKVGVAIDDATLATKLAEECIKEDGSIGDVIVNIVKCFYEKTPKHNIII